MPFIINTASNFAYYGLLGFQRAQPDWVELRVALWTAHGASPQDFLSDFTQPTYPGYATIALNLLGAIYDDPGLSSMEMNFDPVTFQLTANWPGHVGIGGFVVYDPSLNVVFWNDFSPSGWFPTILGDFVTIEIFMPWLYAYP